MLQIKKLSYDNIFLPGPKKGWPSYLDICVYFINLLINLKRHHCLISQKRSKTPYHILMSMHFYEGSYFIESAKSHMALSKWPGRSRDLSETIGNHEG